jgi:DMSO reductase anchor subunit
MGALLYKALLIKEIIYGLLFKGLAGLIVFIEAGHVPKNWFYLAVIIILIFPVSTYVLNKLKKIWPDSSGWTFMGFSVIKMFLLPLLIILFFEKDHDDTEAYVMPPVIAYLILMGLDTKWKIKWLFSKKINR